MRGFANAIDFSKTRTEKAAWSSGHHGGVHAPAKWILEEDRRWRMRLIEILLCHKVVGYSPAEHWCNCRCR